ncbi:transposase orfB, partial [mine drainage metagenome]
MQESTLESKVTRLDGAFGLKPPLLHRDDYPDGRAYRILTLIDECPREGLAMPVQRPLNSEDVLQTRVDVRAGRGVPAYPRSDNGPETDR